MTRTYASERETNVLHALDHSVTKPCLIFLSISSTFHGFIITFLPTSMMWLYSLLTATCSKLYKSRIRWKVLECLTYNSQKYPQLKNIHLFVLRGSINLLYLLSNSCLMKWEKCRCLNSLSQNGNSLLSVCDYRVLYTWWNSLQFDTATIYDQTFTNKILN